MKTTVKRVAAVAASAAMVLSGLALGAPSDAVAATPDTTIVLDPTYQNPDFQGWGTSLVWFANATGGYPDAIREALYDKVFGDDGLNLNIARYNVGGGNAPDVPSYLRPGGAVEGWWKAPEGTTRTNKDWWDPDNPAHWNEDADATQRWWVDRIKADISHWEAFSNSPPYFQTVSGYTSGGFNSSADQIRSDGNQLAEFADYMVGVVERLEAAHGIKVATIDPLNEPNTNYWGTQLGADGNPTGGRQEGAHAGPALQAAIIDALAARLAEANTTTDAVVSAMDETNPGTFATNWFGYPEATRAKVEQLNVHTYGTAGRVMPRDIAKLWDKPLWMSEVGGNWGSKQDFVDMAPGLGQAQHIVDDFKGLEPDAWVLWQPVEDYDNMAPGGESVNGMNWGEIQVPFDCTATDTLETCPIYTNSKYNTVRNFTHYIEPGSTVINTNNTNTLASINADGVGASVVHVNSAAASRTVRLDLSKFTTTDGAVVTPIVTTEGSPLVAGTPVPVAGGVADVVVPARSVVTFEISKVTGTTAAASALQPDHLYRIVGVHSGRTLQSDKTIQNTTVGATSQVWRIARNGSDLSNEATFTLTAADGTVLKSDSGNANWILSTAGDGVYTFGSAPDKKLLEVGGWATAAGSSVTMWQPTAGTNQQWRVVDITVTSVAPVTVSTPQGIIPTLPTTVTATTASGGTDQLAVTWEEVTDAMVAQPGAVTVKGTYTNAIGEPGSVTATINVVAPYCLVDGHVTAAPGIVPTLPATVQVRGASGDAYVTAPVTWEPITAADVAELGEVVVAGTATLPDGSTAPATVIVDVIPAVPAPMADKPTLTATYVEPGYTTSGLLNGNLTDKAYSNWKASNKNLTETFTAVYPTAREIVSATWYFYADGSTLSWPTTIQAEAWVNGAWQATGGPVDVGGVSGTRPVVEVPIGVTTNQVRFVLTARDNTHITASELVFKGYGIDPTLPERTLDCVVLPGVTPSVTATATETVTPTATTTVTPTVTTTATTTTTATATTTASPTSTVTTTATATATATATNTVTVVPTPTRTATVTASPSATSAPVKGDLYSTPGFHNVGGRWWYTQCEPYSQTVRCRTEIWATQITLVNGQFVSTTGWVFNNLTYLPYMTKAQWGTNPLANAGEYTINGRQWKTECNTALTGTGGCRSSIKSTYITAIPKAGGGYTYAWTTGWVFNNIVRFKI